jgi:hypothetical protein
MEYLTLVKCVMMEQGTILVPIVQLQREEGARQIVVPLDHIVVMEF